MINRCWSGYKENGTKKRSFSVSYARFRCTFSAHTSDSTCFFFVASRTFDESSRNRESTLWVCDALKIFYNPSQMIVHTARTELRFNSHVAIMLWIVKKHFISKWIASRRFYAFVFSHAQRLDVFVFGWTSKKFSLMIFSHSAYKRNIIHT